MFSGGDYAAFQAGASSIRTVKARKLVIAAMRAIGTPLLLERSDIGKASVLEQARVPVVADNQGGGDGKSTPASAWQDFIQLNQAFLQSN
jgi:choline dehydrogenase-like flavoprotein